VTRRCRYGVVAHNGIATTTTTTVVVVERWPSIRYQRGCGSVVLARTRYLGRYVPHAVVNGRERRRSTSQSSVERGSRRLVHYCYCINIVRSSVWRVFDRGSIRDST